MHMAARQTQTWLWGPKEGGQSWKGRDCAGGGVAVGVQESLLSAF